MLGLRTTCNSPYNSAEGAIIYVHNNTYNVTSDSNGRNKKHLEKK